MALDILGQAWNISQKGEEIITENNAIKDKATLLKNALNSDLKETGAPILAKLQNKPTISQVVLQIQKIRNVAAPKANENSQAAPRMLKLVLTDGDTYIQAVETASIPSLNLDKTPPGSKLLIHSAKISSGYVLLDSNNCSLLGGKVPALFEKWELAKSVQHHNRQNYSSSDGPPAWVNFGRKIESEIQDKSFKSLDNKNQENKESTKFDLQRQDAIAEAATGAIKKVFGGGSKQTVQPPPVRSKSDFQNRERKSNKTKPVVKEMDDKPLKPLERVSLFDFLEDKLPPNEGNVEVKPTGNYNTPRSAQNNYNSPNVAQNDYNRPRFGQNDYNSPRVGKNDYNSPRVGQNDHFSPRVGKSDYNSPRVGKNDYNSPRVGQNDYNSPKVGQNDYNSPRVRKTDYNNPRVGQNDYNSPRDGQNSYNSPRVPQNQQNRTYYNKSTYDQNSYKAKNEVQPQTSQSKIDDNVVNGLSNNFEKMSVNTQFASRSLRQHLNLGPQKKSTSYNPTSTPQNFDWKVGDECMAIYWEDQKLYNATVTAVTEKTCVVKFKGYGNLEEVLKNDCYPITKEPSRKSYNPAPVEYKRSARTFRRQ